MINGIIDGLNQFGLHIQKINPLLTTQEAALQSVQDTMSSLKSHLTELTNQAKELVRAQVKSLEDLWKVGAISTQDYENQIGALWETYSNITGDEMQLQTKTLLGVYAELIGVRAALGQDVIVAQETLNALQTAAGVAKTTITSSTPIINTVAMGVGVGVPGTTTFPSPARAVGSWGIPNNELAMLHKGEGVVPADFMSGIRSGKIALVGGRGESRGGDVYQITVEGSVLKENDLADAIAVKINQRRQRGYIKV
jgi:hypothetical protein